MLLLVGRPRLLLTIPRLLLTIPWLLLQLLLLLSNDRSVNSWTNHSPWSMRLLWPLRLMLPLLVRWLWHVLLLLLAMGLPLLVELIWSPVESVGTLLRLSLCTLVHGQLMHHHRRVLGVHVFALSLPP